MARLVDILNRQARGDFLKGFPARTQILVADTIIQEIEEINRKSRTWMLTDSPLPRSGLDHRKSHPWMPDDFPRAAPPFDRMWIEGKLDSGQWLGITVTVIDADNVSADTRALCGVTRTPFRWLLALFPIIAADERRGQFKTILVASQLQFVCVDGEGRCVAGLDQVIFKPAPDAQAALLKKLRLPKIQVSVQVNSAPAVLKVFALMNCVNVETITLAPPPSLSKSHMKKYRVPMSSYKVLTVRGVNISQRVGTGKGGQHSAPRRHIVRGHFKHLKSGKTAWWQPHLRGRDQDGSIRKTYRVEKPVH